ncbi:TadE family type IV pilus minor pilin [Bifidobacterium xylocopae]|uniref:TadE family type IV pilus minor pilin n=1 Tax=Bifidobacterium xylocopae TaxID=2493119 RepID=UPI001F1B09E3|nr:TadE family type IV pilus minor pilin [Bifidobacterium xylocopae]
MTAEFAVILPAVVAVAALLLGLTQAVCVSMSCQDAARNAAREVVVHRGEGDPAGVAQQVAGTGAATSLERSGQQVRVSVTCPVISTPLGVLPGRVSGSAVAMLNE